MTLEELWELFPIVLVSHNPEWVYWAKEEIRLLYKLLLDFSPIINHIGSTAIPAIYAKPIIDILIEVSSDIDFLSIISILEKNGYICMSKSEERISFNKGYTPEGYADRVFHIHVHRQGDNNEILFRNYLCSHPKDAKEYEKLKISLWPKFKYNRDGYTEAKSEFVKRIIRLAKLSLTSKCQ